MTFGKMKKSKSKESVYILTERDRDRIEAAIGLMRQIIRELINARRTRVTCETHSPGALYQLAEDLEKIREDQMRFPEI